MSDRTVSPTNITDLRESLLYVLADAETFDVLEIEARQIHDGWIVTLPADRSVSDLVTSLVERGVAIERVHETEASLEELYSQLTADEEVLAG